MSGRIQGFGGRVLTTNDKKAKYLNSPESEIYYKSKVLYGIYESKQAIAKQDVCYLVEGYTDVIQMHQSGVLNVVSSSGTALTTDQIRMISRLTSNIVVLFDGDAAGLRASLRGIDLILEQGMNVKVCAFPEGEDPDSFAKSHTSEEITSFLEEESKDFIQFKASLMQGEAISDPIRKAETVREIIESISKIPDMIKQEIYIQSCSEIMEVSEDTLFGALAQLKQKNNQKGVTRMVPNENLSLVKKTADTSLKVDHSYELEKQIISILLHYGGHEAEFNETIIRSDESGELIEVTRTISAKVYEKVFLDLQQDEIELTNTTFKNLFYKLIESYQVEEGQLNLEKIMQTDDVILNEMVADLVMKGEQYYLHDWEKKNIFVKNRDTQVGQLVNETILSLRRYLIDQKIKELQSQTQAVLENKEVLEDILCYYQLKKVLSKKLNRVL
tara:strand:- start:1476 stop:2807 length:1332 start_codon:yes stop_codon:yes gene_type:complete